MSREVLGTREDAVPPPAGPRPEVVRATSLDAAGRSWRGLTTGSDRGTEPDASPTADSDGRDDGDEPDDDAASPLLSGRRALVAAALVGAVVGGLVAVAAVERASVRQAQSTASLHAWVEPAVNRGSADAIALTVRVVNTGEAPVRVVGAGMDGGLARGGPVSVVLAEDLLVRPGQLTSVEMDAQADCSSAPLAEGSARDGRLQLRVRTEDGRQQLIEPPTGGISMTSADVQEAFCGQSGLRLGLSVAFVQPRPGGELSLSMLNDSPHALEVGFSAPAGTRVVANRDLPVTVESSQRFSLIIALEVDNCTSDAQRIQAGDQVQLVIDGRPRRGGLDSAVINPWVAREVALACS